MITISKKDFKDLFDFEISYLQELAIRFGCSDSRNFQADVKLIENNFKAGCEDFDDMYEIIEQIGYLKAKIINKVY